jgi:hypothetical protein
MKLGKISRASFGRGGYQEAMIGISFSLEGDGWGVCDFWGDWSLKRSGNEKWTEEDRFTNIGKVVMRLNALMVDAKVDDVNGLVGVPVAVEFDGMKLVSWRILTEVL